MKKTFFLILTLAIPVSIFLFLKFFGTNTFDVPVLFEEGIPGCQNPRTPYIVPEFNYIGKAEKNLSSKELQGFIVFGVLNGMNIEKNREKLVELVRIQDAFFEIGAPTIVLFIHGKMVAENKIKRLFEEVGLEHENCKIAFMAGEQLMDFLKCGIALINDEAKHFKNLVLIDPERRIRGIYDGSDVEQTDRLILELKILKQKNSEWK